MLEQQTMQNKQQFIQQALSAINQRDYVAAHSACVTLIKHYGDDAEAYFLLGIVHIEILQIHKAVRLLNKSAELTPDPQTYAYLTKCYALLGNMPAAVDAVSRCPVSSLDKPLALDTVGVSLSRVGLHEEALKYFKAALAKAPDNASFHYNFAVSAKFAGLFDTARQAFEQAIELKPDYYQAHYALSDLGGISDTNNHIERLSVLHAKTTDIDGKLHLSHALAKEYEAFKEYDKAFNVLSEAKQAKRCQFTAVEQHYDAIFNWLQAQQPAVSSANQGDPSSQPIFVLGMPRSGTTLVERIITSHSQVASGGELQDFGLAVKELAKTPSNQVLDLPTLQAAEQLSFAELGSRYLERTSFLLNNKKYLVDKLPFNFFYVGLIRRALPNAKIVCLLREPMDTCIGNFRQLFSLSSPYFAYAYDLESTGRFYKNFYSLVHHWQNLFPDNVRLQSYEELVTRPAEEIPALIDFCGLSWEAACLQVEKNKAPVSTASKVQVREAINTRSIGRWWQYAAHTAKLEALLADLKAN